MSDPVALIHDELQRIAETLGAPVEFDRPYDFDRKDLPLVIIRTASEGVVEDEDAYPSEAWDQLWETDPSIEVLVAMDDPWDVHTDLEAKWTALRQEIRKSSLTDHIRQNSRPRLRKERLEIEDRPDIAILSIQFSFEVERDE